MLYHEPRIYAFLKTMSYLFQILHFCLLAPEPFFFPQYLQFYLSKSFYVSFVHVTLLCSLLNSSIIFQFDSPKAGFPLSNFCSQLCSCTSPKELRIDNTYERCIWCWKQKKIEVADCNADPTLLQAKREEWKTGIGVPDY